MNWPDYPADTEKAWEQFLADFPGHRTYTPTQLARTKEQFLDCLANYLEGSYTFISLPLLPDGA